MVWETAIKRLFLGISKYNIPPFSKNAQIRLTEFVCFGKIDNFAPLKHGEVAQLVRASDS